MANLRCSSVRSATTGLVLSACAMGSITFVFAPRPCHGEKMPETSQNQLQNYGAKYMVHNMLKMMVFAP
jgi:hypothetical protein